MNETQYTCHRTTFNLLSTASLAFDRFLLPLEVWGLSGTACLQDERLGSDVGRICLYRWGSQDFQAMGRRCARILAPVGCVGLKEVVARVQDIIVQTTNDILKVVHEPAP